MEFQDDNKYYAEMEAKRLPQPADWPFSSPLTFVDRRKLCLDTDDETKETAKPQDRFRKFSKPKSRM